MPGPVSDSYDPEFSTGANADDVKNAIQGRVNTITKFLGPQLKNIVDVVHSPNGRKIHLIAFSERELRIIRFALNRAIETI